MFSILDGREHFYQWDTDRKLVVADSGIDKVHFCNRTGSCSLARCVYEVNGTRLVDVPNVILQDNYRLNVYAYDRNYTKHSQTFSIVARTKPADYISTEEEKAQWEVLEERISQIEENGVSDETVANAVKEYLAENPVESGATEEQVAQIAANAEAITALENELDNYYTKSETDALVAAGGGGAGADLTNYYTKTQVDEKLNGYATTTYVAETVSAAQPDLTPYAKKADLLEYVKVEELPDHSIYALKSELEGYQTAEQVNAAIVEYVGVIENGSY